MGHRSKNSLFNLFVLLPWWAGLIAGAVAYIALAHFPAVHVQNPYLNIAVSGFARAAPYLAPLAAGLFFVAAALSAYRAWRRCQLLDRQSGIESLRSLSWQQFEQLVGESFRREGFSVRETGGGGADGGVDLVLDQAGRTFLVQCKHWKSEQVGVKIVREIYGVVAAEHAAGGIVVTTGTFTTDALAFAHAQGKVLEHIDGRELMKRVEAVQPDRAPRQEPLSGQAGALEAGAAIPACPLCRKPMVLRTARRGPQAGRPFWGCSDFPRCRGTRTQSLPYKSPTAGEAVGNMSLTLQGGGSVRQGAWGRPESQM